MVDLPGSCRCVELSELEKVEQMKGWMELIPMPFEKERTKVKPRARRYKAPKPEPILGTEKSCGWPMKSSEEILTYAPNIQNNFGDFHPFNGWTKEFK